jgi:hypothetical protein
MAYRPTALTIIGRLIKALIYSFIALLVGFIVWRVYFSTIPPKGITRLSVNDALAGAFEKRGVGNGAKLVALELQHGGAFGDQVIATSALGYLERHP